MTMDPTPDTKLEERGRTKEVGIMKVSLREQSEERIDNERPESYYFAKYSDKEKKQFEECCVTYNDIFSQLYIVDSQPWKCLDLNKYNAKVEIELNKQKEKKKKKNRPGKKKRDVKVACRQRKLERAKLKKLEEDEKKKQLKNKSIKRNHLVNITIQRGNRTLSEEKEEEQRNDNHHNNHNNRNRNIELSRIYSE